MNRFPPFRLTVNTAALIVGIAVSLIPVFSADVFPFVDYPLHLSMMQDFKEVFTPGTHAAETYDPRFFTPYLGMFLTGTLFSLFFPIEFAGKLIIALYIILTPLSLAYLFRKLKVNMAYVILTLPFLYNFNLYWGFLPYLLSVPLMFFLLGSLAETRHPVTTAGILKNSLLSILVFFTHLFSFLIIIPLWIITGIINSTSRHREWRQYLALLPGVGLLGIWFLSLRYTEADRFFFKKNFRFGPLTYKLKFFPDFVISGDPDNVSRLLFAAFTIIFLFILLLVLRGKRTLAQPEERADGRRKLLRAVIPAYFILLYLAMPYAMLNAVWLFNRTAFLICLTLPLLLPKGNKRASLMCIGAALLLTMIHSSDAYYRFRGFQEESRNFFICLEKMDKGENLYSVMLNERSQWADHTPYAHFPFYYALRKNGHLPNPFAVLAHMVLEYKPVLKEDMVKVCFPQTRDQAEALVPETDSFPVRYILFRIGHPDHLTLISEFTKASERSWSYPCRQKGWWLLESAETGTQK